LGWLREFAADIARWRACPQVVSLGVTFVNEQGRSRGAAERFRALVAAAATPTTIRSAFDRVKIRDVRQWLQNHLPKTRTAKRLTTYHEFNATQTRATKIPAPA
jgi:hypothetical protein